MIIFYHRRASTFVRKLDYKHKQLITQKINILAGDPFVENLNIKKLAGTKQYYRLRIGKIRVIYEVDRLKRLLYIHDIDFRGNIY